MATSVLVVALAFFSLVALASEPAGSPAPSAAPSAHASMSPDPSAVAIEDPSVGDADVDGLLPMVTVEAGDLWFAPNEVVIASDGPATLVLVGTGKVAHNLIVDELGLQLHVGPGISSHVTVSDLPPGTYQFYCSIYGHRRAGMWGTLTVE